MYRAANIASRIDNSYWVSNTRKSMIMWTQIINSISEPYVNADNPYQVRIVFLAPGYDYYADQMAYRGGVNLNGTIGFSTMADAFRGRLINSNLIQWESGEKWKRVVPPKPSGYNLYSPEAVLSGDQGESKFLSQRMDVAYRYIPGTQGL
jgi:hypothetical protein